MTPQIQQLYDAAQYVSRSMYDSSANSLYNAITLLRAALSAFEQSQQEENKTAEEMLHYMKVNCHNSISIFDTNTYIRYDDAIKAMQLFTSQQTASKDKEIAELKSALSELTRLQKENDELRNTITLIKICRNKDDEKSTITYTGRELRKRLTNK